MSKVDITRRDFVKISGEMITYLASLGLVGCKKYGDLSYDDLLNKNYRFVIYDMSTSNLSEDLVHLNQKKVLLIYDHNYSIQYYGYQIGLWNPEGDSLYLTSSYHTLEEALDEFHQRFNVLEEIDAFSLIINEYGPKNEYTEEEIQQTIDNLELSLEEKVKRL